MLVFTTLGIMRKGDWTVGHTHTLMLNEQLPISLDNERLVSNEFHFTELSQSMQRIIRMLNEQLQGKYCKQMAIHIP